MKSPGENVTWNRNSLCGQRLCRSPAAVSWSSLHRCVPTLFLSFYQTRFFFLLLLSSSPQYLWIYSVGDSAFFQSETGLFDSNLLSSSSPPPSFLTFLQHFFFPRALISNVERSQTSNQRWYGIFIQILHLSVTPETQYKMSIVTLVLINQTSTSWLDAACHW